MTSKILYGFPKVEYYKGMEIFTAPGLHSSAMNIVKNYISTGNKILDAGAGEGAFSQYLTDNGYQVISLDLKQSDFKADNTFNAIDLNNKDQLDKFIEEKRNAFDAVICLEVTEHLKDPWLFIYFIKSVLKKEGIVIMSTPNPASWLSRFLFFFTGRLYHFRDQDVRESGHITPLFDWQLEIIMREIGFSDIRFHHSVSLPWYIVSRKTLFNAAFFLAPLYRWFMHGRKNDDILLVTAKA